MAITLITENRDYAVIAMIAGDEQRTVVGHIQRQERDDNAPADTWVADAFGVDEQRRFLSREAAEYWLLAMVIEHDATERL